MRVRLKKTKALRLTSPAHFSLLSLARSSQRTVVQIAVTVGAAVVSTGFPFNVGHNGLGTRHQPGNARLLHHVLQPLSRHENQLLPVNHICRYELGVLLALTVQPRTDASETARAHGRPDAGVSTQCVNHAVKHSLHKILIIAIQTQGK